MIVQGTKDTLVQPDQSEALLSALEQAGVPVKYVRYVGGHSFEGVSATEFNALQEVELDFVAASGMSHIH